MTTIENEQLKRSQDLAREVIAMLERVQWLEALRDDALTKMQALDKYLTSLRGV